MDQNRFSTSHDYNATSCAVSGLRRDKLLFAGERLELVIIFLGGQHKVGVRFMAPGAMHRARWIAKAQYAVKVFMFCSQFKLTAREEKCQIIYFLFF